MNYAEALVECGYAIRYEETHEFVNNTMCGMVVGMIESGFMVFECKPEPSTQKIDPFADTLEGRRQADALEDWLRSKPETDALWVRSMNEYGFPPNIEHETHHRWRLDRIKWCFEQLEKQE